MSHPSLHGDGNFWPQPVRRDRKEYSDSGGGGPRDAGSGEAVPSTQDG